MLLTWARQPLSAAVAGLFSGGAQGYWFDNSRLDTIFQDAAGTTAGALEAPVGLQLDLSQGLTLGAELTPNGDFSSGTTGWTPQNATLAIVNGQLQVTSTSGSLYGSGGVVVTGLTVGKTYKVVVPFTKGTSNGRLDVNGASNVVSATTSTTWTCYFVATGTTAVLSAVNTMIAVGVVASYGPFSCKQISGNHRSQSTSANRPTLSALYNLLTKTESIQSSPWNARLGSITPTGGQTDANGGTAACLLTKSVGVDSQWSQPIASFPAASAITGRILIAKTGTSNVVEFALRLQYSTTTTDIYVDIDTKTGNTFNRSGTPNSVSVTSYGNWWVMTIGATSGTGTKTEVALIIRPTVGTVLGSFDATATGSCTVCFPDVRPTDQSTGLIPTYQRVDTVSAGGYDTVGFPQYDSENGSNSSMTTAGGGGGTTAFFWCAAVTIGKVGAAQTLYSDTGTNTGYRVRINASNQLELSAGNGTAYTTVATVATVNVGKTFVLTAWHDGVNLNVQINQGAIASTAFATATAGTSSTTIGCDNGAATNFYLGRMLEIVHTVNSVPTAGQIAATQAYCNSIGKAY